MLGEWGAYMKPDVDTPIPSSALSKSMCQLPSATGGDAKAPLEPLLNPSCHSKRTFRLGWYHCLAHSPLALYPITISRMEMTSAAWPQRYSSSAPGLSPERVNQTTEIKAEQNSSFQVKVSPRKVFSLSFKWYMQVSTSLAPQSPSSISPCWKCNFWEAEEGL